MIGIYLCDDDDAVRHQIQTALEWKICMENYDMQVVCSSASAQELLDAVEDGAGSIYFLDVELRIRRGTASGWDRSCEGATPMERWSILPAMAAWPGARFSIIWKHLIIS